MKAIATFWIFIFISFTAFGQSTESYYEPLYQRPIGAKPYNVETILRKAGGVKVNNRWYTGLNGFVRTDKSVLSNDFDGLIGTNAKGAYGWGFIAGWIHHENWNVEAEFARSAIHNNLLIYGDNPLSYNFENDKNSITLRGRRRLMFNKASERRSAFWLGAGICVVPNSGKQKDHLTFYGYRVRGRGPSQNVDTLYMTTDTWTANTPTLLAEVSMEYVVRLAKSIDLAFYARRQWGFSSALTTNLDYFVNEQKTQSAKIEADGTGMTFGLSLRYMIHMGYDFEKLNRVGHLEH